MQTDQLTIDGKKPFREFVLDEVEPQTAPGNIKEGLFARVFYGLINPIKEVLLKSLFISIASLSFYETFQQIKNNIQQKNKNLNSFLKTLLAIALFAAECIAVTAAVTGVLGGVILAPKIFMAITGFKTLQSLIGMAHHLFHIGKNYINKYFNNNDETFTYAHAAHVKALKNHFIGFALNSTIFLGVTFGFFLPAVYPALAASAAIVKAATVVKWAVVGIYSSAAVIGLAPKLFSAIRSTCQFIKNKIKPDPKPLDEGNEILLDQPQPSVKLYSNNLDPMHQAIYLQANRFEDLNKTHLDDLLVKLEMLNNKVSQNPFDNAAKSFLSDLLDKEAENIKKGNGSKPIAENIKFNVVQQIRYLLEGGNLNLRYNGANYDNSIFGLVRYYHDRGLFPDIVKSRLKTQGGMQIILVVAHHYFELNPKLVGESPIKLTDNLVTTPHNKPMQKLGSMKHHIASEEKINLVAPTVVNGKMFKPKQTVSSNNPFMPQATLRPERK